MKELLQTQKAFSPTTQAFYDLSFDYPELPDDLVEINEQTYQTLFIKLNQGCHITSDLTASEPRPSHNHIWQNGKWVLGVEKSILQDEIWEQIKQKRHDNARGGVYIKSIGKWFHNDDPTRTQYLALQLLPQLPENLIWKTMDNEFVPMTKALLTEIAMTMLVEEQADFANAERHRLAMLQADDPLEYDYSDGWTAIYEQGVSND